MYNWRFRKGKKRILVIGNSFSTAFTHAFDRLVLENGYSVTTTSSWGTSAIKEIPNSGPWNKANDFYWSSTVLDLVGKLRQGDIVFLINDMASFSPKSKSQEDEKNLKFLETGLN